MAIRSIPILAALAWFAASAGIAAPGRAEVPVRAEDVRPLLVGVRAPAFEVKRADGTAFRFDPAALERPAVVIFYRGGWCPYCNTALAQLQGTEEELRKLGYDVLFLSADSPAALEPSLKVKGLRYTLLSDQDMVAARAFGVAFRVDDATLKKYIGYGIDLEKASGRTHHQLPVPAAFIVDKQGTIQFSYVNPYYKVRLHPELLLTAARLGLVETPLRPYGR